MNWQQVLIGAALLAVALMGSLTPQADVQQGREGTIWYADASHGPDYLAIPIGPGHRVQVCGPARCLSLVSTDAGPNRAMLLKGRIADVSIPLFRKLCGCSETVGYFRGSWRLGGPNPTLPPTDTAP